MKDTLTERLFSLADEKYRLFHSSLMPTYPRERIIGVRMPKLRRLAKEMEKSEQAAFLATLPHTYYEEDNLHALLIANLPFDEGLAAVNRFLPCVDNWATCDLLNCPAFAKEPNRLLDAVWEWMASEHTYTRRFGIGMLLRYFLDDRFDPVHLEKVAALADGEYYVHMMIAWYFATACAKQYRFALPYFKEHRLSQATHNKAIRKAIESYRVTDARKSELRALIRREK